MNTLKRLLFSRGLVRPGLVAQYRFTEGAGQVLYDYSGIYNGTLGSTAGADTNDPTWTAQGLSFGGDDSVTIGNVNKPFGTMQLVFYTATAIDKTTTSAALVNIQGATEGCVLIGAGTGVLTDEIIHVQMPSAARAGWCSASENIPAGWHVLDLTWDGAAYAIALNGDNKPMSTAGTISALTISNLIFGMIGNSSGYFTGSEGYAVFYTRKLTDSERLQNRNYIKSVMAQRGVTLS